MDGEARAEKAEVYTDTGFKENNSEVSTQEQRFNRWLRGLEAFFPEQGELSAVGAGDASLSGDSGRRADTKDHVAK